MKRILIYAALALAVFSLTYCSSNNADVENGGNNTNTQGSSRTYVTNSNGGGQ